jgi:hypothetical protein
MFEHQANSHILHYDALDDVRIYSLSDFSAFDHVDDVDDPGVDSSTSPTLYAPRNLLRSSENFESDETNAEDVSILLPSSLGWAWCVKHNVEGLAEKEAKLRVAQASDAIHSMRFALGFKAALFRTHVRPANTQRTKTRAWDAIHHTDMTVHQHARNYSMAREAYLKIKQAYKDGPELPELSLQDLRINTAILGSAEVGQRNTQLPWIWSFGSTVEQDHTWMDECECQQNVIQCHTLIQ